MRKADKTDVMLAPKNRILNFVKALLKAKMTTITRNTAKLIRKNISEGKSGVTLFSEMEITMPNSKKGSSSRTIFFSNNALSFTFILFLKLINSLSQ